MAAEPPLKVLQVASSLYDWGGIERYVLYLVQGLRGRGHEVEVVLPSGSPLDQRIDFGKIHLALRGQFRFDQMARFLRLFKSKRVDVVHIHFSPDFVVPAMAARMARQPFILMTRHVSLHWSKSKVKRYTKLFDHIIGVSESVRGRLLESGVAPGMVSVAKAGTPALESGCTPPENGPLNVGFFGRIVEDKGVGVLVQAARQTPEIAYEVYGEGPDRSRFEQESPQNLRFMGFVPNVADAMASVHVVAVPSVWEEAFPYSVLEALSLGRPVVASAVGGLPEMLEEGRTGLLVPKGNATELGQAFAHLDADRSQLELMSQNAKEVHRREYTVERMAERIEAVYREQLGRGTKR